MKQQIVLSCSNINIYIYIKTDWFQACFDVQWKSEIWNLNFCVQACVNAQRTAKWSLPRESHRFSPCDNPKTKNMIHLLGLFGLLFDGTFGSGSLCTGTAIRNRLFNFSRGGPLVPGVELLCIPAAVLGEEEMISWLDKTKLFQKEVREVKEIMICEMSLFVYISSSWWAMVRINMASGPPNSPHFVLSRQSLRAP